MLLQDRMHKQDFNFGKYTKMYKKDLVAELNISSATLAKMGKGECVSMDVLERICDYMDCNIGDVMSFEKEEKKEDKE